MAFTKGKSGNPHGRKPNVPNKVTGAAKSAIEMAAAGLGGAKRLQEWCKEDPLNERAFWTQIYTKLLPVQMTGDEGKPLFPSGGLVINIPVQPDSGNHT